MPKMSGVYCEKTLAPKSRVAKKSFRWIKRGRSWLLVGCRRGSFKRGRCRTGMLAVKILTRAHGRCSVGRRIVK